MHNYSNYNIIIFDLGDVIININPPATFFALQDLFQNEISPEDLKFEDYEKGLFTEKEYLEFLKSKFCNFNDDVFYKAWNIMLLDIPHHRIEIIKKLKKTHKVYLLSNTNSTHIQNISNTLKNQFNTGFEELFDKIFFSYEMKMRKPDAEIYEEVKKHISENEKAVFLDDNLDNVNASVKAGIPAILIDKDFSDIIC